MCRVGQKTVFLRIFPIYNTFLVKFTTLQTGSPKEKNVHVRKNRGAFLTLLTEK